MNKKNLIQQLIKKAEVDKTNRRDPRFLNTMGFLVTKGFLHTNYEVPFLPNQRLDIKDAIWAGVNVEPRILEVLPAAVLRLKKHFHLNLDENNDLIQLIHQLKTGTTHGNEFLGIPYSKIKFWVNFPLRDQRTKTLDEKKIPKTFRLHPMALAQLRTIAEQQNISETEVIERFLLRKT